jgi:hypothetical protein
MIDRNVSGARTSKSPTMHILRVLMDAAILYSVALFIALVCFVLLNNGELVMLHMVIQPLIPVIERLLSFDQLGVAHHLVRGAHPRYNPQTKSQ